MTTGPVPQLLWIDLEMTGLDVARDRIIELAALVTDYDLVPLPRSSFHRVLACPAEVLASMDAWCRRTHGESGLTSAVAASRETAASVESALLDHLARLGCGTRTLLLAGNSIHADRLFLTHEMPRLTAFLQVPPLRPCSPPSLPAPSSRLPPSLLLRGGRSSGSDDGDAAAI